MDLIESSRSQWFEVATQFRAIFLSDGGIGVGGGGGGASPGGIVDRYARLHGAIGIHM